MTLFKIRALTREEVERAAFRAEFKKLAAQVENERLLKAIHEANEEHARNAIQARQIKELIELQEREYEAQRNAISAHAPPASADWLLSLCLRAEIRDAVLGDLAQRFAENLKIHGADWAKRIYWAETVRSLAPLVRGRVRKLIKLGLFIEVWRRLFGG